MNNNTPKQMPKVHPMPAPPPNPRPNRAVHDAYSDEALRVAQRHIDQIQEIDRLGQELEEWRRRAMVAEAETKKLEQREQDLRDMLDRQRDQLTDERDLYRNKLNSLVAQFHTAGAIILKCLEASQGSSGPMVSLTKLADEIEHAPLARELEDELPRVVTAGPKSVEEGK